MSFKLPLLLLVIGIFVTPLTINDVFGHGLGGDVAPPIDFGGMAVTVSTILDPSDLTVGEFEDANIAVRFYDTLTDETLEKVTYRVEVWRSDELLARNLFYDVDGVLNLKVEPILNCVEPRLLDCAQYFGSEHSSAPGALYVEGEGRPLVKGAIFDKGGLYNIRVDIEGASSPRTIVAQVLSYDTFVSVAQEQLFTIKTAQAEEVPVVLKTYYDEVNNFYFDTSDNSISFDMPFDWSPDYIKYVQVVHEELQVPKTFDPYAPGKQFKGYVDGVEVDQRVLLIDPYSYEDKNIIHFLVTGQELQRINDVLGTTHQNSKVMKFDLVPQSEIQKNSLEFYLVDTETFESVGTTVNVAWDSRYGANEEVPFELTFLDENRNLLKNVNYGFMLIDQTDDSIIYQNLGQDQNNPGILASEGIDYQNIFIPSQNPYRVDIVVFGIGTYGLDFSDSYGGIGSTLIEVGPGGGAPVPEPEPTKVTKVQIPDWVRNNAGWWAAGSIGDSDFASGIEFMIKEGIIQVPPTESTGTGESVIPEWVRNNAAWWADGLISDDDFAGGLQFLIANGIIAV
ncbi:MAG: peptidase [Nitrosopumilaceae archaeon]